MDSRIFFEELLRGFEAMDEMFEPFLRGAGDDNIPIYRGFAIEVGPEGVPRYTQFGNHEPEPITGNDETLPKEPYSDLIVDENGKNVILTLEVPGIEKKDLNVEASEDQVEVSAATEIRKYEKTVPLSRKILPKTAKAHLNNGVLEITAKLKNSGQKSRKVKVE